MPWLLPPGTKSTKHTGGQYMERHMEKSEKLHTIMNTSNWMVKEFAHNFHLYVEMLIVFCRIKSRYNTMQENNVEEE